MEGHDRYKFSPPPTASLSLHKISSGGQETHLSISCRLRARCCFFPSLILTLTPKSFLCGYPVPLPLSYYPTSEDGLREPSNWAESRSRGRKPAGSSWYPMPPPQSYPPMWLYQRAKCESTTGQAPEHGEKGPARGVGRPGE